MMKRKAFGDFAFDTINIGLLFLISISFIFPFYIVFINSVTAEKFLTAGTVSLWPQEFSLAAYRILFLTNSRLTRSFIVSVSATAFGTIQGMSVIILFGYAMSKERFPFKNTIMVLVIITMMFSGGLIPTYLVFQAFGITNSFYVLSIFNAFNAGNMIFIRNYFMSVPKSLSESASLDGADDFKILARIMLPLSKPMLACIALFTAVAIYNDWTTPMFYNNQERWEPLQLLLKRVLTRIESLSTAGMAIRTKDTLPSAGIRMATVVVVITPILLVYPFIQKYFIAGTWTGSLKE